MLPPPTDSSLVWATLACEELRDHRFFKVRERHARHSATGLERRFTYLSCPDWVNVVAVTASAELVLVEQYRPGTDTITLEIPGGVIDPGEGPEVGGPRELREETGYGGGTWTFLGAVDVNPALQDNVCHTYAAQNVTLLGASDPDEDEHIRVVTVPLAQVPELIRMRRIRHSLAVVALGFYADWAGGWPPA